MLAVCLTRPSWLGTASVPSRFARKNLETWSSGESRNEMVRGSHERTTRGRKGGTRDRRGAVAHGERARHETRDRRRSLSMRLQNLSNWACVSLVHAGGSAWSPCGTPDVAFADPRPFPPLHRAHRSSLIGVLSFLTLGRRARGGAQAVGRRDGAGRGPDPYHNTRAAVSTSRPSRVQYNMCA